MKPWCNLYTASAQPARLGRLQPVAALPVWHWPAWLSAGTASRLFLVIAGGLIAGAIVGTLLIRPPAAPLAVRLTPHRGMSAAQVQSAWGTPSTQRQAWDYAAQHGYPPCQVLFADGVVHHVVWQSRAIPSPLLPQGNR